MLGMGESAAPETPSARRKRGSTAAYRADRAVPRIALSYFSRARMARRPALLPASAVSFTGQITGSARCHGRTSPHRRRTRHQASLRDPSSSCANKP